jgi:DNA adenine methylase
MKNKLLKPFVKWAGGKRQLLAEIRKYTPKNISNTRYYEPFLGGGAVLFDLQPKKFTVSDTNSEMINVYEVVKTNVENLINELKQYKNEPTFFYKIRELDRAPDFNKLSSTKRAARIIYLNKTCFNGLFRVNSQGQFNVPFGNYKNPAIVNEITLRSVSKYLNETDAAILNSDFEEAVKDAKKGNFIYLDPPYDPVSDSSSFTGYTLNGFGKDEQQRLKNVCDELNSRGCRFLLSNSATNFILDLYSGYRIDLVKANRNINSIGTNRGAIDEVLIRNYE